MLTMGSMIVESLDYVLIVDKNYRIIYNTRYDAKLNDSSEEYEYSDVVNKNFFDIYPSIKKENSNIARCIETRQVIVNKGQVHYDYLGRRYKTNNVTFPLMRCGELLAVVELSMDVEDSAGEMETKKLNKKFDEYVMKLQKDAGLITFSTILTENTEMQKNIEKACFFATLPTPTLIYGETGTGKEMYAQAMINSSGVDKTKVVIQNCAAVPENLMEAILFGTVKGIYTGAENKKGLFEQADGGILFLDELNSIPYSVQSKLLRVIQDGTFRPLGGNEDKHVNVKIIAAMNIDPVEAIEKKVFRSDLFYRFSSGLIHLLPLRERREDINMYIKYYLQYYCKLYGKEIIKLDEEVKYIFFEYDWPGNVRELKNVIEAMVVAAHSGGTASFDMLPAYIKPKMEKYSKFASEETQYIKSLVNKKNDSESELHIDFNGIMNKVEQDLIEKALSYSNGNIQEASRILGMPRETLRYKIKKNNIKPKIHRQETENWR